MLFHFREAFQRILFSLIGYITPEQMTRLMRRSVCTICCICIPCSHAVLAKCYESDLTGNTLYLEFSGKGIWGWTRVIFSHLFVLVIHNFSAFCRIPCNDKHFQTYPEICL